MTPRQMQDEFELGVNRYDSELMVSSNVVFYWINEAQERLVKTRYSGLNSKGESFEETQKRTDDLRTLITEATIATSAGGSKPNSYTADLPDNYFIALGEEVDVNVDSVITRTGIAQCTVDTYNTAIKNPFSTHNLHYGEAEPLRLFLGNVAELISDGNYSVDNYYLRYLRYPSFITLGGADCELPEHMHKEIVAKAVNLFLESVKDSRYQTSKIELQEIE